MKNKKKLVAIVIVLTMMLSLFSVAYAKGTYQTLNAWYGDIKIVANGKQVVSSIKPFMVNDTTYVPIRMLGEALGKTVNWDGSTYSVTITDKPDPTDTLLLQQLFEKDNKINELEKKIALLETEKGKSVDLDDLEDDLRDDYEDYKNIEFDISLDGDEDDIEVEIYVDLSDYKSKWNKLKQSDIKDYLQDIVDDILDEFEDADITGFIEDDDSRDELLEFTVSSKGKVSVSYKHAVDLDDLEEDLNRRFGSYKSLDIDISLDGDEDDIEVEIYVSKKEWDVLDSYVETFLDSIVDDILDEFEDADIEGLIEDDDSGDELVKFTVSSKGKVSVSYKYAADLDDLEEYLNRRFGSYKNLDIDISLDGDKDDIKVKIYVSKNDWNDLDDYAETFLSSVVDHILDEFENAEIEGFIEDDGNGDELVSFYVKSNGTVVTY